MTVLLRDSRFIFFSPEHLNSNIFACIKFGLQPIRRNWGL